MLESAVCPACSSSKTSLTGETHEPYRMRRCAACDLIFAHPCRSPGAEWYENHEAYSERTRQPMPRPLDPPQKLFLKRPLVGPRLIDLGCGTGEFLDAARRKGYDVVGLDFNQKFVEFGRRRWGLPRIYALSPGQFHNDFPADRFDVATFFEVLEHDHPQEWLTGVRPLLKPGGAIAFSVPNRDRAFETLVEGDDPPHHLTRWTAPCLKSFLEREGFEVLAIATPPSYLNTALELRNRLRLGVASRLADAPRQLACSSAALGRAQGGQKVLLWLVRGKELVLDHLAYLVYWALLLYPRFQGPSLYCIARLPR